MLDLAAASRIPENILFGTSTWTYPGWRGLIYHRKYRDEREFKRRCLSEYCQCPLFRTVGIDSSFYGPLTSRTIEEYRSQVPERFRWISKVWERLTVPIYPKHSRYGRNAGLSNPDFLNAELFKKDVLGPYEETGSLQHVGVFVFQFPTIGKEQLTRQSFFERLSRFLTALPAGLRYAVEVRNEEYLCKEYFQVLNGANITHCFNHWHRMPRLLDQMRAAAGAGGLKADFLAARILTPLGVSYEQAVKLFQPYENIKRPNLEMREDVTRLAMRAIERNIEAFIIVNNRCEGNAPLTIEAIGKLLLTKLER